jgi:hypothetical protein
LLTCCKHLLSTTISCFALKMKSFYIFLVMFPFQFNSAHIGNEKLSASWTDIELYFVQNKIFSASECCYEEGQRCKKRTFLQQTSHLKECFLLEQVRSTPRCCLRQSVILPVKVFEMRKIFIFFPDQSDIE